MKSFLTFLGRLASAVAFFIPSHVRWKIIAPYALLTLIVAGVGTYFATQFVTGSLEERFDNQLAEASRVAGDSIVRQEQDHLSVVRSVAFTVGVAEATSRGDATELRGLVEPLAANSAIEYLEIVDSTATRILGLRLEDASQLAYVPMSGIADRSEVEIVAPILGGQSDEQGDKFAQMIQLRDGAAFYTGGPILDSEGEIVGAVLVGTSLDTLLPAMKFESLADVTLYNADGAVLGSTFERSGQAVGLGSNLPADNPGELPGVREVRTIFKRDFDLLYGELLIRGEPVGLISVALPSSFIASAGSNAQWAMTAIFAAATLAVLLVGTLVARGVTAPLLRLVRTAQSVAEGDLTARAGVSGRDEVGDLAQTFDDMTERLATQHLATIRALTTAIDARDPYTAGHSVRVGQLAVEIGLQMELPKRDIQYLEIGGYLHDVGKIGIRDAVLLKEGELTREERLMIEEHPRIGLEIVEHVELAQGIKDVVIGHHERLDGTGYPYGLDSSEITVFARIGAVADVFDALTTDRPYRAGFTIEEALSILKREVTTDRLDEQAFLGLVRALPIWGRRLVHEPALRGYVMRELKEIQQDADRLHV